MPMEITFLGTGAPLSVSRATMGMLITADGCAPLLVDTCGGFELARSLHCAGVPLAQIRNIIVTHRHFDHSGGILALFLANMPLDIHALDDTYTGICDMKAGGLPETELHSDVRHHTVEFGERREGGFAVEFIQVEHRVPTTAVRITHRGRTIAFSADSLPCAGLLAAARNADLFICDTMCAELDGDGARNRTRSLMHPTAREAAEIAKQAGAHRLACVHIARFGTAENVMEEAKLTFKGQVEVPDDGARYLI
jgi:ribonuclease BN (tRNA processing enzyme)